MANEDSQPGTVDPSFDPGLFDGQIRTVSVQPDGKILIGGDFKTVGSQSRSGVARLNQDGSLDASFNPGSGIGSRSTASIAAIALQPDGRIVIGGAFINFDGTTQSTIARLNSDGTIDSSFAPRVGVGPSLGNSISAITVLPSGKILLAGDFSSINGQKRSSMARLEPDGTLDTYAPVFYSAFSCYSCGDTASISAIGLLQDGAAIVTGAIGLVPPIGYTGPARVSVDGVASAWGTGLTPNCNSSGLGEPPCILATGAVAVQSDEKILIVGNFKRAGNTERNGFARFNAGGALDLSFSPQVADAQYSIASMLPLVDGEVVIGGSFTNVDGVPRRGIALLRNDGSLDENFGVPDDGVDGTVRSIAEDADGRLLIAGSFEHINGVPRTNLVRLHGRKSDLEAPQIIVSPQSQTFMPGQSVRLTVLAKGNPLYFQWLHNGINLANATNATLVLDSATAADQGDYSVIVSNSLGSQTAMAKLQLLDLATALDTDGVKWLSSGFYPWSGQQSVTYDGLDAAVSGPYKFVPLANSPFALLEATVSDLRNVSFWWKSGDGSLELYANGNYVLSISGTTDWSMESVNLPPGTNMLQWRYYFGLRKPVAEDRGWLDSVRFSASTNPLLPVIVRQPTQAQSVQSGGNATLEVEAAGEEPIFYQWRRGVISLDNPGARLWEDLPGATNRILTLTNVTRQDFLFVMVRNQFGRIMSTGSEIEVTYPPPPPVAPQFVSEPRNTTAQAGLDVSLQANWTGNPWSAQWQFNNEDIPGATNSILALSKVRTNQAGLYRLRVANAAGMIVSSNASLTVMPPAPPVLWSEPFLDPPTLNPAYLAVTPDGSSVLAGLSRHEITTNPGQLQIWNEIVVTKIDHAGSVTWSNKVSGDGDIGALISDAKGNSYIAGDSAFNLDFQITNLTTQTGQIYTFAAKLDDKGKFVWASKLRLDQLKDQPGSFEWLFMTADGQDHLFLTGAFRPRWSEQVQDTRLRFFVAQFDRSGELLWGHYYDGPGQNNGGNGIALDPDGNVVVIANLESGLKIGENTLSKSGIYLLDYGPAGELRSLRWLNDGTARTMAFHLADAHFAIFDSLGILTQYNAEGESLWRVDVGTSVSLEAAALAIGTDGSVVLQGSSDYDFWVRDSLIDSKIQDLIIRKYSPDGQELWTKVLGGPNRDYQYSVGIDNEQNIYSLGSFWGPFTLAGLDIAGPETIVVSKIASDSISDQQFLRIRKTSDGLRLSWPDLWADWSIESTESLERPAAWKPLSPEPVQMEDDRTITIPISSSFRMFRLKK